MAHSDMNTEAKTIKMSGMNHTEGGWPREVRTDNAEHRIKYIRSACRYFFKWHRKLLSSHFMIS